VTFFFVLQSPWEQQHQLVPPPIRAQLKLHKNYPVLFEAEEKKVTSFLLSSVQEKMELPELSNTLLSIVSP